MEFVLGCLVMCAVYLISVAYGGWAGGISRFEKFFDVPFPSWAIKSSCEFKIRHFSFFQGVPTIIRSVIKGYGCQLYVHIKFVSLRHGT